MAKSYIVEGAGVRCNRGGNLTRLQLPQDHGMYFMNKPILNERDCVAGVNVMPFGTCQILGTCKPLLSFQWEETQGDAKIGPCSGLITDSFLGCYWGGCITIKDDGQDKISAGTNGNIDWDEMIAASNGANPIGNPVDDNSLSAILSRTYCATSDGDLQLSNSIPGGLSFAGAVSDSKVARTNKAISEKLFGENVKNGEYAGLSRNARRSIRKEWTAGSKKFEKTGNFCGEYGNIVSYGTTAVMDVYNTAKKEGLEGLKTSKFASTLMVDMALVWGTVKVTTALTTRTQKRSGEITGIVAGFLVGQFMTTLIDGPLWGGETVRSKLQDGANDALKNMRESWNRPTVDKNGIKTITSCR